MKKNSHLFLSVLITLSMITPAHVANASPLLIGSAICGALVGGTIGVATGASVGFTIDSIAKRCLPSHISKKDAASDENFTAQASAVAGGLIGSGIGSVYLTPNKEFFTRAFCTLLEIRYNIVKRM